MKTVKFTEMKKGTKDEYLLLDEYEQNYIKKNNLLFINTPKYQNEWFGGEQISYYSSYFLWDCSHKYK